MSFCNCPTCALDNCPAVHTDEVLRERLALLTKEVLRLVSELAKLQRGEFICKQCGLRKDAEFERGDF
jgi:hypothetical protein